MKRRIRDLIIKTENKKGKKTYKVSSKYFKKTEEAIIIGVDKGHGEIEVVKIPIEEVTFLDDYKESYEEDINNLF